jgi:hypothetical protein
MADTTNMQKSKSGPARNRLEPKRAERANAITESGGKAIAGIREHIMLTNKEIQERDEKIEALKAELDHWKRALKKFEEYTDLGGATAALQYPNFKAKVAGLCDLNTAHERAIEKLKEDLEMARFETHEQCIADINRLTEEAGLARARSVGSGPLVEYMNTKADEMTKEKLALEKKIRGLERQNAALEERNAELETGEYVESFGELRQMAKDLVGEVEKNTWLADTGKFGDVLLRLTKFAKEL